MKHQSKFTPQEQQRTTEQQSTQGEPREFASVDELLRYDAQQIPVPPRIAERLHESIGGEPARERSWWRRLFGK